MLPLPKEDTITTITPIAKESKKEKTKTKKDKVEKAELLPDGATIYADAGARPNPGFGGWGIHGYTYNISEPKKGNGCKYIHTPLGYSAKGNAAGVTPLKYVDAYGTITYASNNGAEVIAATNALAYAAKANIKSLNVITDSRYVIGGVDYLHRMISSNWVKTDGTPYKNRNEWLGLNEKLQELKAKDIKVTFSWVKGHNGEQGNTLADTYATIGVINSSKNIVIGKQVITEAAAYWNDYEDKHPMLFHRRVFFTSHPDYNEPGEYYLSVSDSDADKKDLHGEKSSTTSYSYVTLKTPDPYIEMLRERILLESETEDSLLMCRLEGLYHKESRSLLDKFGNEAIGRVDSSKLDLRFVHIKDGEPLLRELNPPKIAMRTIVAVNYLKGLLQDWKSNKDTPLVSNDITSLIYKVGDKQDYTLLSTFTSLTTGFEVQAKYVQDDASKLTTISPTLGLDLPDRNTLKKLEKYKPRVTLVTWQESPNAVRYATIISAMDGVGIWAGYYCNYKYLDVVEPNVQPK